MSAVFADLGFADAKEWASMVSSADLSTPEMREAFNEWKERDGTKDGLVTLGRKPILERDPFRITDMTALQLSGGRTSGYMLWRVLQSNPGLSSENFQICFNNTGKENEPTLRFVRDIGIHWGVKINWLEYRDDDIGYAIVDFDTASRGGRTVRGADSQAPVFAEPCNAFLHGRIENSHHAQIPEIARLEGWRRMGFDDRHSRRRAAPRFKDSRQAVTRDIKGDNDYASC